MCSHKKQNQNSIQACRSNELRILVYTKGQINAGITQQVMYHHWWTRIVDVLGAGTLLDSDSVIQVIFEQHKCEKWWGPTGKALTHPLGIQSLINNCPNSYSPHGGCKRDKSWRNTEILMDWGSGAAAGKGEEVHLKSQFNCTGHWWRSPHITERMNGTFDLQ